MQYIKEIPVHVITGEYVYTHKKRKWGGGEGRLIFKNLSSLNNFFVPNGI